MTPNLSHPTGSETLAIALRQIAHRAYHVLRVDHAEDRCEVRALLDEIAQSRWLFERAANDELRSWLDRLEDQLWETIAPVEPPDPHPHVDPTACGGVGVA